VGAGPQAIFCNASIQKNNTCTRNAAPGRPEQPPAGRECYKRLHHVARGCKLCVLRRSPHVMRRTELSEATTCGFLHRETRSAAEDLANSWKSATSLLTRGALSSYYFLC